MGDDDAVGTAETAMDDDTAGDYSPSQWIYRNLTPWRIYARFGPDHSLLPRCPNATDAAAREPADCPEVAKVLSIPALGEVKVPKEDSSQYNPLKMRRLGQIEVRPAPSELWANLPRAIVIFGWLVVALVFGTWALFGGGASGLPWRAVVATVVAVPVVALGVATLRELRLYQRFSRYRRDVERDVGVHRDDGDSAARENERSLEGVELGGRLRGFVDGMPRHAGEVAVLMGAVVVSVIGLGVAIHLT